MSNLLEHARAEMKRAGLYDTDTDYGGGAIADCVEKLVSCFASQGHSGGSAHMTLAVFDKVVRFETLSPITSDPAEWMQISDEDGVCQNRRNPSLFSTDGGQTHYNVNDPKREARPSNSP